MCDMDVEKLHPSPLLFLLLLVKPTTVALPVPGCSWCHARLRTTSCLTAALGSAHCGKTRQE
jgi:hypothetical protein